MKKNKNFEILRKINIVKGYLLATEINKVEIIELLNEFFIETELKEKEIEKIKEELNNGNKINLLNLLNNYKEEISKLIFRNPCSKIWYDLVQTENHNTKFCLDCKKNVYLVESEEELIKRRNLEQCVAINTLETNLNKENDKNYKACHIKFKEEYDLGLPF